MFSPRLLQFVSLSKIRNYKLLPKAPPSMCECVEMVMSQKIDGQSAPCMALSGQKSRKAIYKYSSPLSHAQPCNHQLVNIYAIAQQHTCISSSFSCCLQYVHAALTHSYLHYFIRKQPPATTTTVSSMFL